MELHRKLYEEGAYVALSHYQQQGRYNVMGSGALSSGIYGRF